MGYIFARLAITARSGLQQHPVLIAKAHGKSIKLEFGNVFNGSVKFTQLQLFTNPYIKVFCSIAGRVRLCANAEHRHSMLHLTKSIQQTTSHTLRR